MVKRIKLLSRILNNPTNVRFEDIQKLLLYFGFSERQPRSGSSHYTYRYGKYIITVPKHYPVNKVYVRKVIKILRELDLI